MGTKDGGEDGLVHLDGDQTLLNNKGKARLSKGRFFAWHHRGILPCLQPFHCITSGSLVLHSLTSTGAFLFLLLVTFPSDP